MWKECMVHTAQNAGQVPGKSACCGGNKNLSACHKSLATSSWALTLHLCTLMISKYRPSSQICMHVTQCHRVCGFLKVGAVWKETPSWSARPLKTKALRSFKMSGITTAATLLSLPQRPESSTTPLWKPVTASSKIGTFNLQYIWCR